MGFIKPDLNKLKQLSPKDINLYIKETYFNLSVEDYHSLIELKNNLIDKNEEFRTKLLNCDIFRLAFKQTIKELPESLLMTEKEKRVRPDLWDNFKNRLFSNAEKILRYKERAKGLEKRRAKKLLTK
jgi:hypothetical protein